MIQEGSSTFYKAFGYLPTPQKEAVFVVYAFCRILDNAVDEPDQSEFTLDELEANFADLAQADGHFIWPALRWLYAEFPNVGREPFLALMRGMRQDIVHVPFTTVAELEDYSYLVAGTVGELLVPILHPNPREAQFTAGIQLGKAMQIVNILRDIGEDQGRNRRYIPSDLMDKHGYSMESFEGKVVDQAFVNMVEELATLADFWLNEGLAIVDTYPKEGAFCMELATRGYMAILEEIRAQKYQVFTKRAIVSTLKKANLFTTLQLKYSNPFRKQATNQ
jgi:phytoene synthase